MQATEFKTTFWQDFTIADHFGENAVRDTFNRASEWQYDYRYVTDLVMVLNRKIWQHYEAGNKHLAIVYDELWWTAREWALDNLKGDEWQYFYDMTD